ncbi:glycoside hydrolase family 16 protein [Marinivivus vitaminiproducens]|uniref:glycoside hydrolase family 16 protein n=1 Tax=Marinivivus vitaminiproducens TaxID=3035935 RepID=UPI0027A2BBB4|nr:glycoside hydrolase family 16 protein [Geminicoccaceae bacterium SCSIO 64248]
MMRRSGLALAAVTASMVLGAALAHADVQWRETMNERFDDGAPERWTINEGGAGRIFSYRQPQNVKSGEGSLALLTRAEKREGKEWTTGMVVAKDFLQQYGYFEARLKITEAPQINNAFWLMQRPPRLGDGQCELDIAEIRYPGKIMTNVHWDAGPDKGKRANMRPYEMDVDLSQDFHTYGFLWTEKRLAWYFDGKLIRTERNPGCTAEARVRFSTAVMTKPGRENPQADGTAMEVQSLRVFAYEGDEPSVRDLPPDAMMASK